MKLSAAPEGAPISAGFLTKLFAPVLLPPYASSPYLQAFLRRFGFTAMRNLKHETGAFTELGFSSSWRQTWTCKVRRWRRSGVGPKKVELIAYHISSISRAGNVGQTNYSAAKAGLAAMTVTWAKELARYKIRVAGIAPGFSDTRMVASIPPKVKDRIVSAIPLRRFARPEEIARAALFILHDDYYTGRILEVDGGLRL